MKSVLAVLASGFVCVASAATDGTMKSAPVWDLKKDAGALSEQLAKDGFLPLDSAHRFEVPQTAVRDSQAFTVEIRIRCEKKDELKTVSLLRQKTPTTGWGLSVTLWGGIGSPIALLANDAAYSCGWFTTKVGATHTFVIAARRGLTVVYWNGRVLKRFYQTIIPNLEPIRVGDTVLTPGTPLAQNDVIKPGSKLTEMEGVKLLSLKFWGPEEEYFAKGESMDFAEGFRGGPGWLLSCPTEDPAKKLPRILCYGDSILGGYGPRLIQRLKDKAYVYRWGKFETKASGDDLDSAPYAAVCKVKPFDFIVFNNGLHSLSWDEKKVSDEQLKATQRKICRSFRENAPQAKIFWLSTTPHTSRAKNAKGKVFATGDLDPVVRRINRLTAEVMSEEGVPVLDGYGALSNRLDLAKGDGYHWTGEAYDRLVDLVVGAVGMGSSAKPAAASVGLKGDLESARRDCEELGKVVERLEAKGGGQYSRMSCEVIRYSLDAMAKDLTAGYTNRVIRGMKEVSKILPRALAKAKRIEAGEEKDVAVPRFKSGPVKIRGPILYGDREWPDGRIEHDKPVMLNGWGHFGGAQRDLELLNRTGHNYLQMEVGLNKFLPKPDVIATNAFDGFFAVADRAQKADTKIDLHLCVHYMAGWPLAKSPASKFCRNHFIGFCVHDPHMVGVMTNFQRQAAKLTKNHSALASYCLTNEPGSQNVSKCPHMRAIWEAYLAERYGTPAKMNELWQTNFTDFAAVPMPAYPKLPKTPLGLEFVRCDRQAFADFHAKLAKAVRDVAPDVPLHAKTTVDVSLGSPKECFFWSMDAARFAEIFDLIDHDGVHCYCPQSEWLGDWIRSQVGYDFIRSFADKPMINTENHIVQDNCSGYGIPKEHVYSALWQDAIHGQRATAHWTWERGGKKPYSKAFNGLAPERPEILETLGRCSLDLQRFSDELVPIQEESPTVVIMWSLSSKVLGKSHGYPYAPASFLGEPVGFVNEEALSRYLRDGVKCRSLRSARVIVLSGVTHLPDESVAALKKLEREGVAILAVGDTLAFDDFGRPRGETPWPSRAEAKYHPIFDLLVAERGKWNLPHRPRLVQPVYGIETHGYEKDGVCRLSICNQLRGTAEIELPSEGVDLISGKKTAKRFKIAPLMPLFVEYRK